VAHTQHHLRPQDNDIHVWHARLSEAPALDVLSASEAARADRMPAAPVRERFRQGRVLTRVILASYLGQSPEDVAIVAAQGARPELAHRQLSFNVSHSGDHLVLAIANRTVGVDIEHVDTAIGAEGIAARFFAPAERAALDALAGEPDMLRRAFFQCWSRKEAVVKALGDGLGMSLSAFAVSVPPAPARLVSAIDPRLAPGHWVLADLACAAPIVGAVAMNGASLRVIEREWSAGA
jgi:4'-phosphopantetheinyl transferase